MVRNRCCLPPYAAEGRPLTTPHRPRAVGVARALVNRNDLELEAGRIKTFYALVPDGRTWDRTRDLPRESGQPVRRQSPRSAEARSYGAFGGSIGAPLRHRSPPLLSTRFPRHTASRRIALGRQRSGIFSFRSWGSASAGLAA